MRFIFLILCVQLMSFTSVFAAKDLGVHLNKVDHGGLENILKKKYFRVLTTRNPYDYYIYQGNAKGVQYEMIKEFTKHLNKKFVKRGELRIVFEIIPVDFDQLIPMLNEGKGDIIAVGLTKTPARKKLVDFTTPYQKVDDVIVTRKELANNPWKEKTFHVQKNSSYKHELIKIADLVNVEKVDANFNAADLMEFVSLKKYDYTLVNSFWAKTISKRFDNLVVLKDRPFRKKVEISWAVRKNNNRLLSELNSFLPKVKKGSYLGNLLGYKYFYDAGKIQSDSFDIETSTISKYDETLKKYAH